MPGTPSPAPSPFIDLGHAMTVGLAGAAVWLITKLWWLILLAIVAVLYVGSKSSSGGDDRRWRRRR